MSSTDAETIQDQRLPAPGALVGAGVLGILAVLALPNLADNLPHPGRLEQAQYALTCLGVVMLTSAYVILVSRTHPALNRSWMLWTLLYGAGLVIVKFIMSPTAFEKSPGASLRGFITAGMVVMPLYLAGLAIMRSMAERRRGSWSLQSKLVAAAGFAVLAVVTRLVVAFILGTASEYLEDFIGPGLILPVVAAAASFAMMESFDQAGTASKSALGVGIALVLLPHLLWPVYMYRLFA